MVKGRFKSLSRLGEISVNVPFRNALNSNCSRKSFWIKVSTKLQQFKNEWGKVKWRTEERGKVTQLQPVVGGEEEGDTWRVMGAGVTQRWGRIQGHISTTLGGQSTRTTLCHGQLLPPGSASFTPLATLCLLFSPFSIYFCPRQSISLSHSVFLLPTSIFPPL